MDDANKACKDLRERERAARRVYEEARDAYDELADQLGGETVLVTTGDDELATLLEEIAGAVKRVEEAEKAHLEAAWPWLECMKRHIRRP